MFPTLFSIGAFEFATIWLFGGTSVLIFSYVIFLQSEDQVLPTVKVFDLAIIATVLGLISGKLVGFILNLGAAGLVFTPLNFWGATLLGLAVSFYFARKFKLSRTKIVDIFSLAAIPAAAVFYLGYLITLGISPVRIFAVVWLTVAALFFARTARKIQFPGFYLVTGVIFFAILQIVLAVFNSQTIAEKIFNLTISGSVLTILGAMLYKRRSEKNFAEGLKMAGLKTLEKVKKYLLRQRKTLEGELESLKKDDPLLANGRDQSHEVGEDAYELEGHERITIVREELKKGLSQVKKALAAIGIGKYGKCERCGKPIEPRRLKVLPQAILCFSCEQEVEKGTPV